MTARMTYVSGPGRESIRYHYPDEYIILSRKGIAIFGGTT